jgi:hypothetical protein
MISPRYEAAALRARIAQWNRFARWEAQAEARRVRSLTEDLAWLSSAVEMAKRFDPEWGSLERLRQKAVRLARTRTALAALGRTGA